MRVGIIVPAFNVAGYICAAIDSVIAQSHQDWAMVVVDDGSRDATAAIVAAYAERRLRLLRQANAGVSAARNAGLARLGTVDAVLFLDADDWLAPDALARLGAALAPTDVACCGAYAVVGPNARPGDPAIEVKRRPCGAGGEVLPALLERNLFANGGHVLLRQTAVAQAGGFPCNLAYGEDWEFMVRIALQGGFSVAPGPPVLFVRRRPSGAYLRMAADPDAHDRCTSAIFGIPALATRFGGRLSALRRRPDAERDWVVGRELLRQRRRAAGLRALWRSLRAHLSLRRAVLFAAAVVQPLLPPRLHGPFRAYAD